MKQKLCRILSLIMIVVISLNPISIKADNKNTDYRKWDVVIPGYYKTVPVYTYTSYYCKYCGLSYVVSAKSRMELYERDNNIKATGGLEYSSDGAGKDIYGKPLKEPIKITEFSQEECNKRKIVYVDQDISTHLSTPAIDVAWCTGNDFVGRHKVARSGCTTGIPLEMGTTQFYIEPVYGYVYSGEWEWVNDATKYFIDNKGKNFKQWLIDNGHHNNKDIDKILECLANCGLVMHGYSFVPDEPSNKQYLLEFLGYKQLADGSIVVDEKSSSKDSKKSTETAKSKQDNKKSTTTGTSGNAESKKEVTFTKNRIVYKKISKDTAMVIGTDNNGYTVNIPNTVTYKKKSYKVVKISKNAFKNNKVLTNIKLPANLKAIEKNAFVGCKKLKNVTINSNNLTTIGKNVFMDCKKLKCIKIKTSEFNKLKKQLRNKVNKNVKWQKIRG